jgi:hypothetical protein
VFSVIATASRRLWQWFGAVTDAAAEQFKRCDARSLWYAGGGRYGFGRTADEARDGGTLVGLYTYDAALMGFYGFQLCFVVDGVASFDCPIDESTPHNAVYAMYRRWVETSGSDG